MSDPATDAPDDDVQGSRAAGWDTAAKLRAKLSIDLLELARLRVENVKLRKRVAELEAEGKKSMRPFSFSLGTERELPDINDESSWRQLFAEARAACTEHTPISEDDVERLRQRVLNELSPEEPLS